MKYIKKKNINVVKTNNKYDLFQYFVLIIKISILMSNSKNKKMFEKILMNYEIIMLIIDIKIIKKKNLRIKSSSK